LSKAPTTRERHYIHRRAKHKRFREIRQKEYSKHKIK
jgi:hypothetical protein